MATGGTPGVNPAFLAKLQQNVPAKAPIDPSSLPQAPSYYSGKSDWAGQSQGYMEFGPDGPAGQYNYDYEPSEASANRGGYRGNNRGYRGGNRGGGQGREGRSRYREFGGGERSSTTDGNRNEERSGSTYRRNFSATRAIDRYDWTGINVFDPVSMNLIAPTENQKQNILRRMRLKKKPVNASSIAVFVSEDNKYKEAKYTYEKLLLAYKDYLSQKRDDREVEPEKFWGAALKDNPIIKNLPSTELIKVVRKMVYPTENGNSGQSNVDEFKYKIKVKPIERQDFKVDKIFDPEFVVKYTPCMYIDDKQEAAIRGNASASSKDKKMLYHYEKAFLKDEMLSVNNGVVNRQIYNTNLADMLEVAKHTLKQSHAPSGMRPFLAAVSELSPRMNPMATIECLHAVPKVIQGNLVTAIFVTHSYLVPGIIPEGVYNEEFQNINGIKSHVNGKPFIGRNLDRKIDDPEELVKGVNDASEKPIPDNMLFSSEVHDSVGIPFRVKDYRGEHVSATEAAIAKARAVKVNVVQTKQTQKAKIDLNAVSREINKDFEKLSAVNLTAKEGKSTVGTNKNEKSKMTDEIITKLTNSVGKSAIDAAIELRNKLGSQLNFDANVIKDVIDKNQLGILGFAKDGKIKPVTVRFLASGLSQTGNNQYKLTGVDGDHNFDANTVVKFQPFNVLHYQLTQIAKAANGKNTGMRDEAFHGLAAIHEAYNGAHGKDAIHEPIVKLFVKRADALTKSLTAKTD